MVKMEDAVIARLSVGTEKFEMLVDPYLAMDLKNGKEINFNDLLAADTVFKDAHKGEAKSEEAVKKVFSTEDVSAIAEKIIKDGEVQLTTDQRRQLVENRRKEIVTLITRNAINPQTNTPHPPQRIENALEEAKIQVDLSRSLNEQVTDALKEIKKLIPISMEKLKIAVKVPAVHSGKANSVLHHFDLQKEEWQTDGSLIVVVEIPAGMKNDLFAQLNSVTHGDCETKILESK